MRMGSLFSLWVGEWAPPARLRMDGSAGASLLSPPCKKKLRKPIAIFRIWCYNEPCDWIYIL